MALTMSAHLKFKTLNFLEPPKILQTHIHGEVSAVKKKSRCTIFTKNLYFSLRFLSSTSISSACKFSGLTRASSNGDKSETFGSNQQNFIPEVDTLVESSFGSGDSYVALFIRMLGLDNDPLDREQAVDAIWKYSLGGKHYVDNIMKYRGIVNLIVNLLRSKGDSACEAAAGLLAVISSINAYRDVVADSGAIEEITGVLSRSSVSSSVKEQSICTLWNLSVDEKLRAVISNSEILPLLIKFLEDEDIKVKEAAAGVLANLTLSQANHKIMVEAGVIPKLAKLLAADGEESKVIRKVSRNALLELAKDDYNRILVMEEGLVLVPLVGAAAYKSYRPALYSWPSLPDGTKIEQNSKLPSRYGASELLLGLNVDNTNVDLEEAKMKAVVGRTQQHFLARIGAIETKDDDKSTSSSSRFTLLPWMDAVARLVLILGLEDESAIARAAGAIADAAVNEHMRISFREAGAVKHLVELSSHPSESVRLGVIRALDQLSCSNNVCQTIEDEGVLHPLITLLKQPNSESSPSLTPVILNILTRILDPNKAIKSKFYDGSVNGSNKGSDAASSPTSSDANEMASSESTSSIQTIEGRDFVDSTFLSCLVDILRTSNPDLQKKSASVLEYVMVTESVVGTIVSADIKSGLEAVFQQKSLVGKGQDDEGPELLILELEEAGQAISAACRLLTRLLDYDQFRRTVDPQLLTKLLRQVLISDIPLQYKDWVAACLVKLSYFSRQNSDFENPISVEVTLYETIPRLIEKIKNSFSPEVQEAAVLELNRIVSEGLVDSTRSVADEGGIFPLVKLVESRTERAAEASLAILYNLSMNSENHPAIIAAGALPPLRKIVVAQRPQWMRALRLLRSLPS